MMPSFTECLDASWIDHAPARDRSARGRAVAATAHPLASWAALTMLRQGGSAVDAAIAAQAVLTAVEPNASGIGGGALMLVAGDAGVQAFEGLSGAPARVTDRLDRDFDGRIVPADRAAYGGRTVGVPGALRALELAHRRHGRLAWKALFQPAIELASEGYPLSAYLLRTLLENPSVQTEAMAWALFCGGGRTPLPAGTTLRNPALAATLAEIAEGGADAFYLGRTARDICLAVAADPFPGVLTEADFAAYQAVERAPVRFALGDMQVHGGGLPAFGAIAVGQVIGIAAAAGLGGIGAEPSADAMHILAEAGRLAFADRAVYAGDPEFTRADCQALLDPGYLQLRAGLIDMKRRKEGLLAGDVAMAASMTSHLSIADADGCVVSMTTTINNNFGGRISVGGFYLNNVMTNFASRPLATGTLSVNAMARHKRPRTSIAPCIVCDAAGRPVAAVGAGGGSRIIGYVANALMRLAQGLRDPQEILSSPHVLNFAGITEIEPPLDRHAADLVARGHWVIPRRFDGGTQMAIRSADGWHAGGDPRRDGIGLGLK
jgi:gamma-glutamyltranspeptidase/glutathione hydrolase